MPVVRRGSNRRVTVPAVEKIAGRKHHEISAPSIPEVSPGWRRAPLHVAAATSYPERPVRVVVPQASGGAADISARLMGQWLSERLGQPFVVENRPGAGGSIGTEAVVTSPADGHTILLAGSFNAIGATLYDKLNYDFIRDIAPVAGIMRNPLIMEVSSASPARTVAEFIAYAKANPGKVNVGSAGNGSPQHLASELFKMMTATHAKTPETVAELQAFITKHDQHLY